jgi:hypothetical protein
MNTTYQIKMKHTDGSWMSCSDEMTDKTEAIRAFHQMMNNMPGASLQLISSLVILSC